MEFWTKESIKAYDEACKMLRYPEAVVGEAVRRFIRLEDTVMEVGAGSGAVTSFLAPLCEKVYALEPDGTAFRFLEDRIMREGLANAQPIHKKWSTDDLPPFTIIVGFYVDWMMKTFAQANIALSKATRGGAFFVNRAKGESRMYREVLKRIGAPDAERPAGCKSGCRILGYLEAMGGKTSCQPITHDFGQPVENEEEAAVFLWRMLHVDDSFKEPIRRMIGEYITEKEGRPYVPFPRESCLILFER